MEPNNNNQINSTLPPSPPPPPQPKTKRRLPWAPILLIILALVLSGGIYYWQHAKVTNTQAALNAANFKIAELQTKQKLFALPSTSNFGGPGCESKDNSQLIVASLTPEPIDNYQAYIVK
jgi:uncharacterized protein HemX